MDISVNKLPAGYQQEIKAKDGLQRVNPSDLPSEERTEAQQRQDRAEISALSLALNHLSRLPDPRPEKIKEIMDKINTGQIFVPPNLENATRSIIVSLFCGKQA